MEIMAPKWTFELTKKFESGVQDQLWITSKDKNAYKEIVKPFQATNKKTKQIARQQLASCPKRKYTWSKDNLQTYPAHGKQFSICEIKNLS